MAAMALSSSFLAIAHNEAYECMDLVEEMCVSNESCFVVRGGGLNEGCGIVFIGTE